MRRIGSMEDTRVKASAPNAVTVHSDTPGAFGMVVARYGEKDRVEYFHKSARGHNCQSKYAAKRKCKIWLDSQA
jgi:hypothetical protein